MISKVPIDIKKIKGKSLEREALRIAIAAEFDAISLYEQLAAIVENKDIKDVLLDVAREEKTHVGEFGALLLKYDDEQSEELKKGRKEVEEIERV
jgi:rubrerythrin